MNFNEMSGDREAQPSTADFAGTRNVDAVETLEDAGLIGPGDADAGVGNREGYFGAVGGRTDHDLAAGRSVLHRVVQQILQNFGETAAVSGNIRQRLLQIHGDTQIFFGGGAVSGFDAALDKLRNAQTAYFQLQLVSIHFGEHEQIVGEPRETPRVLKNDLEKAHAILRVVDGAREKRFRKTLDGGKRRAQFMRNTGDEIAAHALEFAKFGDVVQHQHSAGRFASAHSRGGGSQKSLPQRGRYQFPLYRRFAAQHIAHGFNQFRLSNGFDQSATDLWRHIQAKNFGETSVRENHAVRGVHHHYAFYHAAENRCREIALISKRADGEVEARRRLT